MAMEIHQSAEDYLEAILMIKEKKGYVRSIDVANQLSVSKPSVSYATKRLRENGYITFNEDGTFSSKIAGTPFNGKYTFDEATQKITLKGLLLSMSCYTKKEANGISILFEAKKLLTVLQTMSAMSGNKDLQTIGDLSKKYDGVRVGFDLKR